jgi:hypothetical protein
MAYSGHSAALMHSKFLKKHKTRKGPDGKQIPIKNYKEGATSPLKKGK